MINLRSVLNGLIITNLYLPMSAFAAQIFITNYPSEANAKVFVTKYQSEANCIVYETQYSSDNEPGVWFYTKYKSDARAVAQEFGSAHNAAHPYLRPALEANATNVVQKLASILARRISEYRMKK